MGMPTKSGTFNDFEFPKSWSRADKMTFVNRNILDPTVASVELFLDDVDNEIVARVWDAVPGS